MRRARFGSSGQLAHDGRDLAPGRDERVVGASIRRIAVLFAVITIPPVSAQHQRRFCNLQIVLAIQIAFVHSKIHIPPASGNKCRYWRLAGESNPAVTLGAFSP